MTAREYALNDDDWSVPEFSEKLLRARATRYVVMIPVLNEGRRIREQLELMRRLGIAALADIVVVDGGSTDGSLEKHFLVAQEVRALLTKQGGGRLSAQLRCGYAWALREAYEGIITIDGNGKDNPDAIPSFIAALDEGFDYIQASRFIPGGYAENTPVSRWFGIRFLHAPLLSLAAGHWFTDTTQGYRAYSRKYLLHPGVQPFRDVFNGYELLAYLTVRASQLGMKVRELPTRRIYPRGEKVPTKIKGLQAQVDLLAIVSRVLRGVYTPEEKAHNR